MGNCFKIQGDEKSINTEYSITKNESIEYSPEEIEYYKKVMKIIEVELLTDDNSEESITSTK